MHVMLLTVVLVLSVNEVPCLGKETLQMGCSKQAFWCSALL